MQSFLMIVGQVLCTGMLCTYQAELRLKRLAVALPAFNPPQPAFNPPDGHIQACTTRRSLRNGLVDVRKVTTEQQAGLY